MVHLVVSLYATLVDKENQKNRREKSLKRKNLIFIAEAMKFPEVLKLVQAASEKVWYKINDITSFEHTCYRNIGKALMTQKIKSVGGIANRIIEREIAWYAKNRGREIPNSIDSMARIDEQGNEQELEIVDVFANVEKEVLGKIRHKEIVELLAKNDDRRRFVLGAWTNGYDDDVELSNVLADVFGGKSTGQRRFIQRFEKECKERLATA